MADTRPFDKAATDFAKRLAKALNEAREVPEPDNLPAVLADPEPMIDYLRHEARTSTTMAYAVAIIEQAISELAEYKQQTAETLAFNRDKAARREAELDRLSTRCRFFEQALARMLDGRGLNADEQAHARRLLADGRSRQDYPEHPNVHVPGEVA